MKSTLLFLLLPVFLFAQNVKSSRDTIMNDGEKFIRFSEVIYEDGRRVTEEAPMDSVEIAKVNENEVRRIANEISELSIRGLERKRAGQIIQNKARKVKDVSGVDVLDSIGFALFEKISDIDWQLVGIDTAPVEVDLNRGPNNFRLNIRGQNFKVVVYNEYWLQIVDLYGKNNDLDLFLWNGAYVSPDYRVIMQAKGKKSERATREVSAPPTKTKKKQTTISKRN